MPRIGKSSIGPLSAFGTVRNFVTVMREMSFEQEREQAERQPRILIIAPDEATARTIGEQLTGTADSPAISTWPIESANRNVDAYDVVVVFDPATKETQ